MKCPIMTAAGVKTQVSGFPPDTNCLKNECAWWDDYAFLCGLISLVREARYLNGKLEELLKKMLQEMQFRK